MIPSLLQIPSAVSDSKLHSVLPNNGKGDFQFERSTGATRINRDGLIEEVGYFSSELVQNGNFSELGAEQIINGGFEGNANNWTLEAGITYGNNNIVFNSVSNQKAIQTQSFVVGKTYKVSIELQEYTSGTITVRMGSVPQVLSTTIGVQTWYIVATGNLARIEGTFGVGVKATLSNVSVKQVDPNDRWNLETGWSYGDNRLNFTTGGSSNRACSSSAGITNGKTYKLSFNVLSISAGQVALRFGGMAGVDEITATSTGVHSGIITANSSANGNVQIEDNDNSFVGSITDVSVVEVQGDRPRLSYDITNGVVEDKPHLLLEPSATNLVTFSEDFSQWTVDGEASISSDSIISPDGTKNSDKLIAGTTSARQSIKLSSSNSGNLSFSIFAKKGEYSVIQLTDAQNGSAFANFNLDTGAVGSTGVYTAAIVDMGNDWYRCKISWNASVGILAIRVGIVTTPTSARVEQFAGNGSDGLYIYGAQLEQQTYCTSYIPTAGTTITRAAETCNNSKPSVNSTEGVLYCEIAALVTGGENRVITISDGSYNNSSRIQLYTNTNEIEMRTVVGGAIQALERVAISNTLNFNKIAYKYKANDFQLYVNGVKLRFDTSGSVSATGIYNTINFDDGGGSAIFYGKVKGLAVYNEALTDAQLIELTS